MAVHQIVPRRWTESELELVRLVVARCWEALERSRVTRTLQESASNLALLNERLREQDRRKDEFLATLAHELRNPLAPIRTGLEILRAGAPAEQAEKIREMMQRQLQHLVRMVDDLLDVSRVTLGKVSLKKERMDFRSVLHSALETTRPLIEARNHELAVRLPQDAFALNVDHTRMTQVVANIVGNAAKYTPPGGRIQLTAETDGQTFVLKVSDSGVGIPTEMLPRVFDLFTQVRRTGSDGVQDGLGLGLTLVRRLVEMHEGAVEAESPGLGKGSTFTVRLPLARAERAAPAPVSAAEDKSVKGASLRVLVVDDNADAAETLAMLLGLDGHLTRVVHSGEEALAAVADFCPDIAFVDIGLPDLTGYEVARRLRASANAPKALLLVALTGWGMEEDRRQAHSAGFDVHLVKPVDLAKINEVLTGSRKPRA
jgi:signal transduction histidine kinase/ActR/RegA family two-component response regulator